MVDIYASDQEQREQVKKWLKEYGWPIITGIVLALCVNYGWRAWKAHQFETRQAASIEYMQMMGALHSGQTSAAFDQLADQIIKNYSSTPYASVASLMLAKQAAQKNDLKKARQDFQWVIDHGSTKTLRQIARIRAARILLAQHKPKLALTLLNDVEDDAYVPAIDEVKGDAYVVLGRFVRAKKAYQQSLQSWPEAAASQPLLEMKLNELAGVS